MAHGNHNHNRDKQSSASPVRLELKKVGWHAGDNQILRDVTLDVNPGEMVGLVGPNGSGKSSLLRCIYRYYKPSSGAIYLDGTELATISLEKSSRKTAAVLQESSTEFQIKVFDVVLMGRSPHKGVFHGDSEDDYKLAMEALEAVNLTHLAGRFVHTLSGGEKQRMLIARGLCQQAGLLILDEPTNHLDVRHQLEVLSRIRQLPLTTVAALHDLNFAALFCDRVLVLCRGEIVAQGNPEQVLTKKMIKAVYGVEAKVFIQPETGKPSIHYLPLSNSTAQ